MQNWFDGGPGDCKAIKRRSSNHKFTVFMSLSLSLSLSLHFITYLMTPAQWRGTFQGSKRGYCQMLTNNDRKFNHNNALHTLLL